MLCCKPLRNKDAKHGSNGIAVDSWYYQATSAVEESPWEDDRYDRIFSYTQKILFLFFMKL